MCEKPLKAIKSLSGGRPRIVKGDYTKAESERLLELPCGKCLSCRLNHASQWSTRVTLESKRHEHNHFLTLTYRDEDVPANGVDKLELSKFIKRLREHYERKHNHVGIRFFACGEYGSKYLRPHYHVILFNCPPFGDEKYFFTNKLGQPIYLSETLEKLWRKGQCSIGSVTDQSAGYVARYSLKKVNSALPKHLAPEFVNCSRRPGIGFDYLDENYHQIYRYDEIILLNGKTVKPPKYYDRKFKQHIGDKAYEGTIGIPRQIKGKAMLADALALTGLTEKAYLKQKVERQHARIKQLQRTWESNRTEHHYKS